MTRRREIFTGMGIEFKLNIEVGRDVQLDDLLKDYDAVFLGVGTYQSMRGGLENEDASGVFDALPFLIANTKQIMALAKRRTSRTSAWKANASWFLAVATPLWTACGPRFARTPLTSSAPIAVMRRTCRARSAK